MFFKEFFKNKINALLMGISLLSIVPLVVLIKNALDLLKISDMAHTDDKFIIEVMSRGITNPTNLIGFIVGILVWVSAAGFAAYGLNKKKVRSVYGYMSLVFGVLGFTFSFS